MKRCARVIERTSQHGNQLLCLLCSPFNPNSKCFDCKFIPLLRLITRRSLSFCTTVSSFQSLFPSPLPAIHLLQSSPSPLTSSNSPLLSGPGRNVWGSMFCSGRAGLDPLSAGLETTLTDLLYRLAERSTVNVLGVNLSNGLVFQGCFSPRGSTEAKNTTISRWMLIVMKASQNFLQDFANVILWTLVLPALHSCMTR